MSVINIVYPLSTPLLCTVTVSYPPLHYLVYLYHYLVYLYHHLVYLYHYLVYLYQYLVYLLHYLVLSTPCTCINTPDKALCDEVYRRLYWYSIVVGYTE